jgi:hypothetical protein
MTNLAVVVLVVGVLEVVVVTAATVLEDCGAVAELEVADDPEVAEATKRVVVTGVDC